MSFNIHTAVNFLYTLEYGCYVITDLYSLCCLLVIEGKKPSINCAEQCMNTFGAFSLIVFFNPGLTYTNCFNGMNLLLGSISEFECVHV